MLFMFHVCLCYAVLSEFLCILCGMFSCVRFAFQYGVLMVLGQVWYLPRGGGGGGTLIFLCIRRP